MNSEEKYLEHLSQHRPSIGGRIATFGAAATMMAAERYIPIGGENIPTEGPVIIAANHISYADTVTLNAYLLMKHRQPNILVKDSLLKIPVIGSFLKSGHVLPIHRGQGAANIPVLDTAVDVLDRGDMVVIYPEGSAGRGEDTWPTRAKSGLGYLALRSGAPVVPVAQWGAQDILWRGEDNKQHIARWPFGKPITINMGEPLTFSAEQFSDDLRDTEKNQIVSDVVMQTITEQLSFIRQEEPKGYYTPTSPSSHVTLNDR